ncbi:MAG: hypothetical protein KIT68_04240 [Phycisphaeraceae bacterium]|nr:hypothetical protein [Phycisphaeraceae bacterium]
MNAKRDIEIYIHLEGQGEAKVVEADLKENVSDVLARAGLGAGADFSTFVGESTACLMHADDERDDLEDEAETAPLGRSLEDLGARRGLGLHLHCHRCRKVVVEIHYRDKTKRHRFSPSTTVATVIEWARRKFRLTDPDNAKLRLQICDSTERPALDRHLGEITARGSCSLCFNLVFEQKVEG